MSDAALAPVQVSDAAAEPDQLVLSSAASVHVSAVPELGSHFSMALQVVAHANAAAAPVLCTRLHVAAKLTEQDTPGATLTIVTAVADVDKTGAGAAEPSLTRCAAEALLADEATAEAPSLMRPADALAEALAEDAAEL